MALIIAPGILAKIGRDDHGNVTEKEVRECFSNHCGRYCYEQHPEHVDRKGNPTPWFVAETNQRRLLKIMFVRDGNDVELRSAYPATQRVTDIFHKFAK
jgi:hypothetical protein